MANTPAPFGFRQLRRLDGGAPTAGFETLNLRSSDTTLYFTGDPVASLDSFLTAPSSGAVQITGIFMGCEFYNASVNRITWAPFFPGNIGSSLPVKAWVCTDPDMLWIAQCSTNAVVGSSRQGENIAFSAATSSAGNQLSGISVVSLSTDIGTSSSYPFRIYDFYSNYAPPGTNGTDNTSAGQILVVAANNWDRNNLVGV